MKSLTKDPSYPTLDSPNLVAVGTADNVEASAGATEPTLTVGVEPETNLAPLADIVTQASALDSSSGAKQIASPPAPFIPSLGASAKPLNIYLPPSPSPLALLREAGSNLLEEISSPSHWPSIFKGKQVLTGR